MKIKIAVSFSGKDSTLALHDLRQLEEYEVCALFATVTEGYNRTSIHGVREELLEAQAASIGLPLLKVSIPQNCSNEQYQRAMADGLTNLKSRGISHMAFGDLYLEDVRRYREDLLNTFNMTAVFPLWKENTGKLIQRFLDLGYKTIITCVDLTQLSERFSGRIIDENFLNELPGGVDPCGENGEYHSFVFDGPIFKHPVLYKTGEQKITPDFMTGKPRFCYTDLLSVRQKD